jgi:hypothetical protein
MKLRCKELAEARAAEIIAAIILICTLAWLIFRR